MSNPTVPQPEQPQHPQHPQQGAPVPPNAPTQAYPTTPLPGYTPQSQQPTPGSAPGQPARTAAPQAPSPAPYTAAQQPQRPTGPTTLAYTNTYALLAIIFAFISPIAGIIFGHLGLGQIKRNGDQGRGLALTGLIISYAYFAFLVIFIVLYIGFIVVMFGALGAGLSELGSMDDYGAYDDYTY